MHKWADMFAWCFFFSVTRAPKTATTTENRQQKRKENKAYRQKGTQSWNLKTRINRAKRTLESEFAEIDVCDALILHYVARKRNLSSAGAVEFSANRISVMLLLLLLFPLPLPLCALISCVIFKIPLSIWYKFNINRKIITVCSLVAVSTIDRNQKISSGQFNSNLNPIKDLVTNPRNAHTHEHKHMDEKRLRAHLLTFIWWDTCEQTYIQIGENVFNVFIIITVGCFVPIFVLLFCCKGLKLDSDHPKWWISRTWFLCGDVFMCDTYASVSTQQKQQCKWMRSECGEKIKTHGENFHFIIYFFWYFFWFGCSMHKYIHSKNDDEI